jgi:hypothetical protein
MVRENSTLMPVEKIIAFASLIGGGKTVLLAQNSSFLTSTLPLSQLSFVPCFGLVFNTSKVDSGGVQVGKFVLQNNIFVVPSAPAMLTIVSTTSRYVELYSPSTGSTPAHRTPNIFISYFS